MMTQAMRDVLADPAAHDSLKTAIRALAPCDPVDAATDALHLDKLMRERLAVVTAKQTGRMMATLDQS